LRLEVIAVVISAGTLVMSLAFFSVLLRKVGRIDRRVWQADQVPSQIRQLFRQIEALDAVYRELQLSRSLPSTRDWAASPDALRILAEHALREKPRAIVECGSGISTVVLARCAQLSGSGHVYSLDHEAEFAEKTRIELERHGLRDWATVIHAPLEPQLVRGTPYHWYGLEESIPSEIDMLFIDGPPTVTLQTARYPAGPCLLHRLSADGVAFLDDAARPGEKRVIQMWQEEFDDLNVVILDCEKGLARLSRDRIV
jgi:predicted O-methyltransferase YrrM